MARFTVVYVLGVFIFNSKGVDNQYLPKYGVNRNLNFLSRVVFSNRKQKTLKTNSKDKQIFEVSFISTKDTYLKAWPKLSKLATTVQVVQIPNPFRINTYALKKEYFLRLGVKNP